MTVNMNMYQYLGFAVVWLVIGRYIKNNVKFFQKYCIPAPIIGGFLFAIISLICYVTDTVYFKFDTTLQTYWMVMFFTSVGYNAGFSVLKRGGIKTFIFLGAAVGLAATQNLVAQSIAKLIDFNPMLAVMLGSTSFTGGFGTAAAFAPTVDPQGTLGALSLAVAVPTFGSIISSIMGGPVGNRLINKYNLAPSNTNVSVKVDEKGNIIKKVTEVKKLPVINVKQPFFKKLFSGYREQKVVVQESEEILHETPSASQIDNTKAGKERNISADRLLSAFMLLVIAAGLGIFISNLLSSISPKLPFPIYIGAMILAAVIRNFADFTGLFSVDMEEIDAIGSISLNLFLAMALVSLKLWQLVSLAVPLFIILGAQIVVMYFFARFITFNAMGRNYDAAVITSGHIGFGFAATPNAMANMGSVCEKYGYSEIAFFVVPIVGSLFIDMFNVLIISFTIWFVS